MQQGKGPKRSTQASVIVVTILMIAGVTALILSPSEDPKVAAQKQADQVAAQKAEQTQLTKQLSPQYCKTHASITLAKVDSLSAAGFPIFAGKGNLTPAQCELIISKLYEVNPSAEDLRLVADGKIKVGMDWRLLFYSWGAPDDANTTSSYAGQSGQWVYGDSLDGANYVYVENGIVTSFQQ